MGDQEVFSKEGTEMSKFLHVSFYCHVDPLSLIVTYRRVSEGSNGYKVKENRQGHGKWGEEREREGDQRPICLIQVPPISSSPERNRVEVQPTEINGHYHLKVNKILFQAMNTLIC